MLINQALQWTTGLLAVGAALPTASARPARTHHRAHDADDAIAATATAAAAGPAQSPPVSGALQIPGAPAHISLVVSNFARPRNIEHITRQVADYQVVDETLVWDVSIKPENRPLIDAGQTWVIRTPQTHTREKWGLLTRFKDCLLAQNEWVLMTDDDQLLHEAAILEMMKVKARDPDRLVCYFGREIGAGHAPAETHYQVWDPPAPAQVPICLTKSVLTDRRFCLETLRYAHLMQDVAEAGEPKWNGEDIWHAFAAFNATGKLHVLLPRNDATYEILPEPDGIGDARPGPFDHRRHREAMVRLGTERLGLNVSAMHLQPWSDAP